MTIAEPIISQISGQPGVGDERCPWCDQAITHSKFEEIQERIKAEEQERTRDVTRHLRAKFKEQEAERTAKAKADLDRVKKESKSKIEQVTGAAKAREAAALRKGEEAARKAGSKKLTEAVNAKKAAEGKVKKLQAEQKRDFDKRLKKDLDRQREAFEKTKTEAVNAERAKVFNDHQKLQTKVGELQRQLQNKTAEELGEGAEVNLLETLKGEFEDDRIKRISKGVAGADIWHDVRHNDRDFGRIVYDSKNRNLWRNSFVSKLRKDQLAAKADHAILTTSKFPAGERQLCIRDGVIVTNPARVLALVCLLREHILQVQRLRLSQAERKKKTAALYDFISSERSGHLLDQIETLTDEMLELEVKEEKAQNAVRRTRGGLIRSVQKANANFRLEVDRIIEGGRES